MIATNYPNRDALYVSYTIYRDAMRRFIIRCLEKNCDTPPEQLINKALNHSEHNNIEINNAASIDIGDFPDLIVAYWKNTVSFSEEFDPDSNIRTDTEIIRKDRKLWAHPGPEDADPRKTQTLLSLISKILGEINEPDEKRKVDCLLNQLFPYDSEEHLEVMSNLEKVSGELTTLKKHQEATDEKIAVVEEHCANIADTLNQLRTALVKPLESKEHFTNESNQLTKVEVLAHEKSVTSHPSMESSPLQNKAEISNILEVGQHLTGSVKRIIANGVFITSHEGEGFIPLSELTLESMNHPSDLVSQGDEVEVSVIDLNEDNSEKLPSLRLKFKHDEWIRRIDEKGYQEDLEFSVTITSIHDTLGAFVELEPGISGLIHLSTMSSDFFESLDKGKEIKALISRIDLENEKIDLRPTSGQ